MQILLVPSQGLNLLCITSVSMFGNIGESRVVIVVYMLTKIMFRA